MHESGHPGVARCSQVNHEPLPGSAKQMSVLVMLEYPYAWSKDILDGGTFGEELTEKISRHLENQGAGLQLIRKSGREGHLGHRDLKVYVAFAISGVLEELVISDPQQLVNLDVTSPGKIPGAHRVNHPVLLVCTHGKRDLCCAVEGRPLAAGLAARFPEGYVWEASHTKGHRFAPSMLLMPWGYSLGRLNIEAASTVLGQAIDGALSPVGNRGRGIYAPQDQVAELAVLSMLTASAETVAPGELAVVDRVVTHPDGRRFAVELGNKEVTGVLASCGKPPKDVAVPVAEKITQLS